MRLLKPLLKSKSLVSSRRVAPLSASPHAPRAPDSAVLIWRRPARMQHRPRHLALANECQAGPYSAFRQSSLPRQNE